MEEITTAGYITDIKRFATHDGPGIRTTVFLKGCFLRCKWCANPETYEAYPQLYFIARRCAECGRCVDICPEQAISMLKEQKIDRARCSLCFKCLSSCFSGALQQIGRKVTVGMIVNEVEKDAPFYGSEGGVTISGGEPFYQPLFTIELLKALRSRGISTVLDTSGYGNIAAIEQALEYTNLVLLDIKHMDAEKHREGTGVTNEVILKNGELIAKKCQVRISFPLIPDYNDGEENIKKMALYARNLGIEWIDIEPLHFLGASKYEYLGLRSPYGQYKEVKHEAVLAVKEFIESYGLKTTIGRMM